MAADIVAVLLDNEEIDVEDDNDEDDDDDNEEMDDRGVDVEDDEIFDAMYDVDREL